MSDVHPTLSDPDSPTPNSIAFPSSSFLSPQLLSTLAIPFFQIPHTSFDTHPISIPLSCFEQIIAHLRLSVSLLNSVGLVSKTWNQALLLSWHTLILRVSQRNIVLSSIPSELLYGIRNLILEQCDFSQMDDCGIGGDDDVNDRVLRVLCRSPRLRMIGILGRSEEARQMLIQSGGVCHFCSPLMQVMRLVDDIIHVDEVIAGAGGAETGTATEKETVMMERTGLRMEHVKEIVTLEEDPRQAITVSLTEHDLRKLERIFPAVECLHALSREMLWVDEKLDEEEEEDLDGIWNRKLDLDLGDPSGHPVVAPWHETLCKLDLFMSIMDLFAGPAGWRILEAFPKLEHLSLVFWFDYAPGAKSPMEYLEGFRGIVNGINKDPLKRSLSTLRFTFQAIRIVKVVDELQGVVLRPGAARSIFFQLEEKPKSSEEQISYVRGNSQWPGLAKQLEESPGGRFEQIPQFVEQIGVLKSLEVLLVRVVYNVGYDADGSLGGDGLDEFVECNDIPNLKVSLGPSAFLNLRRPLRLEIISDRLVRGLLTPSKIETLSNETWSREVDMSCARLFDEKKRGIHRSNWMHWMIRSDPGVHVTLMLTIQTGFGLEVGIPGGKSFRIGDDFTLPIQHHGAVFDRDPYCIPATRALLKLSQDPSVKRVTIVQSLGDASNVVPDSFSRAWNTPFRQVLLEMLAEAGFVAVTELDDSTPGQLASWRQFTDRCGRPDFRIVRHSLLSFRRERVVVDCDFTLVTFHIRILQKLKDEATDMLRSRQFDGAAQHYVEIVKAQEFLFPLMLDSPDTKKNVILGPRASYRDAIRIIAACNLNLTLIYVQTKKPELVVVSAARALKAKEVLSSAQLSKLHFRIGVAEEMKRRFSVAKTAYETSLMHDPENAAVKSRLAKVVARL